MKKSGMDYLPNALIAMKQCRSVTRIAERAAKSLHKSIYIFVVFLLFVHPMKSDLPDDTLNIIFYQFLEESEDIYMEIIPGDRFRLPLIRGYQVRVDLDKIEIIALTGREVVEPDGKIMPSGHVAQIYNLGRLSTLEYEVLIHFDHQTDRYFVSLRNDSVRVSPFREEFSKIIIP